MASGGYHPPANPAPVSGPGAHSQRTDGGLPHQAISAVPDQPYGDAGAQLASQAIAPMAGTQQMPSQGALPAPQQAPPYTAGDFARQSERPNEPVTHGVPIGPGSNIPAAPSPVMPNPAQGHGQMTQLLQQLAANDSTGILAQLADMAAARNA